MNHQELTCIITIGWDKKTHKDYANVRVTEDGGTVLGEITFYFVSAIGDPKHDFALMRQIVKRSAKCIHEEYGQYPTDYGVDVDYASIKNRPRLKWYAELADWTKKMIHSDREEIENYA